MKKTNKKQPVMDATNIFNPQKLTGASATIADLGPVWILEEVTGHLRAQGRKAGMPRMRLYCLNEDMLSAKYETILGGEEPRVNILMSLLEQANVCSGVIVCSFRTVSTAQFIEKIKISDRKDLNFVVEIDPTRKIEFARAKNNARNTTPKDRLMTANWQRIYLSQSAGDTECYATNLGKVTHTGYENLTCFALSAGGIKGYQRGTQIGISSLNIKNGLRKLAQLLAWTRWVRLSARKVKRAQSATTSLPNSGEDTASLGIRVRANRKVAANHDINIAKEYSHSAEKPIQLKQHLTAFKKTLNVMELFAGGGGMGLGFLQAKAPGDRSFRIISSAEIHPVYTETLRRNHTYMEKNGLIQNGATPREYVPMDLCSEKVRMHLGEIARDQGGVDVLIGGPPCQGFSSANRNSWSSSNPNNRLVDAFLDCVSQMSPKVLLMENVQGILWTPREGEAANLSVAAHVLERLAHMGYLVFPKLLDSVWYGVPQNRNRFFLLGIHKDIGYLPGDFGEWGPFPKPTHGPGTENKFVTVHDAISDLPILSNGDNLVEHPYKENTGCLQNNSFLQLMRKGSPRNIIWDHVTSKHADYVIERYKGIEQGQNWQAVRNLMTNYADVERTHSNIYRRLAWDEPSITIGHYRKSMIIHPSQHRGLSLREASRLQSFPDWFRFAGTLAGSNGGLMHKQQQLANAVCPNVTKAVAEFILNL